MIRVVGPDELRGALSMAAAIDALAAAFGGERLPEAPPRAHLDTGAGDLLLMPSWSDLAAGVKLVTVNPANPSRGLPLIHGVYILFDRDTLAPVALIDGSVLTALRTAAVSGVATRHLARDDASSLVIFGAGTQARSHLEAMAAVRNIERVTIVSRTRSHAEALAEEATGSGFQARAGSPDEVSGADLVCTCTTSTSPVFDGSKLQHGAHVNAVGGYKSDARELDDAVVSRARIVVELRSAALKEAGDLVIPVREGVVAEDDIAELADVVKGEPVRRDGDDITLFKSVGVAFEDLVIAGAVFKALRP